MAGNHALVFGASGLAGWAVVNELLSNYPASGTFDKVTAATNRPLKVEDSFWPAPSPDRPKLELISGVNLLSGSSEEFTPFLKDTIRDIDTVTHVFYFAYKQEDDWTVETSVNSGMFDRVVHAVDALAPGLKFIAFPSGTRGYGIFVPGGLHKAPLVETMDPLLPPEYRKQVFYHAYQEILRAASAHKSWTWSEIRPDAIIGFAPNGSTYNLAAHWATYLSAYALLHGRGSAVAFPGGTAAAWTALSNDASAGVVARAAVWASLRPDVSGGELFNVADSARPTAMGERWPKLAAWFGLEGVGPVEGVGEGEREREREGEGEGEAGEPPLRPGAYLKEHARELEERGLRAQVWQGEALDMLGDWGTFDRQLSLEKIRRAGFWEERESIEAWYEAFERFREAGMIV